MPREKPKAQPMQMRICIAKISVLGHVASADDIKSDDQLRSNQSYATAWECTCSQVISRSERLCYEILTELREHRGTSKKAHPRRREIVMGKGTNRGIRSFEGSLVLWARSRTLPSKCSHVCNLGCQSSRLRSYPPFSPKRSQTKTNRLRKSIMDAYRA